MATPEETFTDLDGKVITITGGSRGLGKEMALAFARCGAHVVVASRKKENCDALAAEITEKTGIEALPVECHVGEWDQCDALFEKVIDHFGKCDVLVNNAGMSPLYGSLTDVSQELFDKVLNVNLRGPFRLSAKFGEQMVHDGSGSIINISSVAAAQPSPHEVPYGAAKAGLQSLTKSFSRAYAPQVRVNCIMPGPFLTDISDAWSEATHKSLEALPLGRGGQPREIVGAALYFASDASSFTTGAVLKIDGGLIASPS
ncbi:MAG: glucose 1-dehydrogenase [Actinomycetota bacterium]|nr:glucose 1-dehydrogenase [Actinomycetota bacterium]